MEGEDTVQILNEALNDKKPGEPHYQQPSRGQRVHDRPEDSRPGPFGEGAKDALNFYPTKQGFDSVGLSIGLMSCFLNT